MSDVSVIEWWRHPDIAYIDSFVESNFDRNCIDAYFDQFNAIHISDWKHEITIWIEDRRDLLDSLQEMVDGLPDDEHEEYELEGNTVRPLTSKVIK